MKVNQIQYKFFSTISSTVRNTLNRVWASERARSPKSSNLKWPQAKIVTIISIKKKKNGRFRNRIAHTCPCYVSVGPRGSAGVVFGAPLCAPLLLLFSLFFAVVLFSFPHTYLRRGEGLTGLNVGRGRCGFCFFLFIYFFFCKPLALCRIYCTPRDHLVGSLNMYTHIHAHRYNTYPRSCFWTLPLPRWTDDEITSVCAFPRLLPPPPPPAPSSSNRVSCTPSVHDEFTFYPLHTRFFRWLFAIAIF